MAGSDKTDQLASYNNRVMLPSHSASCADKRYQSVATPWDRSGGEPQSLLERAFKR